MRLLVLADGDVGRRVCEVLRDRNVVPTVLVVDDASSPITSTFPTDGGPEIVTWSAMREPAGAQRLRDAALDLGLLAWWPHILEPEVLTICGRGYLNLHPSLLPHGRGKDPNVWALVDGTPFGVTIHHVTAAVDAGDIAFQRDLEVTWLDDGARLYRRAQDAIVELFADSLDEIVAGDIPATPQGVGPVAHRRSELDGVSRIDLDAPTTPRQLLALLRARTFPGHPAAWFEDGGERYEVRITVARADQAEPD